MIFAADRCRERAPNIYVADSVIEVSNILNPRLGDIAVVVNSNETQFWRLEESDESNDSTLSSNSCDHVWVPSGGTAYPIINVTNFGATGDSVTDDTDAIQHAINFAEEYLEGSVVLFPPGQYLVSSPLLITKNYVQLTGTNSIGGLVPANTFGATIIGTASGMGEVIRIRAASGAIYGVTIKNLRISASSGLASPPDGISLFESSECSITDCYIGFNLRNGIYHNGGTWLLLDNLAIVSNQVGLHQTVDGTTVFLGNADVQATYLNFFNNTTAAVKISGYVEWGVYDNCWMENSPYGFLISPRAGADMYVDHLMVTNVYFFNGASSPYINSRFVSFQAPAGAANYIYTMSAKFTNCKTQCVGSPYVVEFLRGTNTNAATSFRNIEFHGGVFYLPSTSVIYSDSSLANGQISGLIIALTGVQSGAAVPVASGSGVWQYEQSGNPIANTILKSDASILGRLVNSPITSNTLNTIVAINAIGSIGGAYLGVGTFTPSALIDVQQANTETTGIRVSTSDNNDPTVVDWANGGSQRFSITVPDNASAAEFRSANIGGRDAGMAFYNDTLSAVVPILTLTAAGRVGVNRAAPGSNFAVTGLPVYANNAAALAGGLGIGDFYRTGADPDPVCVVH